MNCGNRKIVFNRILDILPLHFPSRILLDKEGYLTIREASKLTVTMEVFDQVE